MAETKTPAEMLAALGKPFPRNAIKTRPGGGGKALSYVETHTVIHRLNSATNGWDFHVKDVQWRNDLLMVLGELTIHGLGTRSGFGVQKVSDRGGEDLVKGASSDALKKCATLFGVGLELYGSDYEANATPEAPQRPQNATKRANGSADASAAADPDRERVMRHLHKAGKDAGLNHADLHALIVAKGFESMTLAPLNALIDLGQAVINKPDDLKAYLARQKQAQAELLPDTNTVPNPDRFTS